MIEFRVLGPLQVVREGRAVPLGGTKQRGLLAQLLLDRNRVVPRERLVDALWGDDPPASAANSIHVYVSRLRRLLEEQGREAGTALLTEPPGYLLRLPAGALDADEFERLLAEGKAALAADAYSDAEGILAGALALWRGPALADLAPEPYAQAEIARLEGLRLEALEARFEAMFAVGRQAEAVAELEALVDLHPLDELLRAQLMRTLYRSGRQAEALESYRAFRRLVSEDLGLEPGPELRELEQAILRQDPSLRPPEAAEAPRPPVAAQQEASPAPSPPVEAALEREVRKLVTVLVCDVSGEPDFGEALDPELRRHVVGRYLEEVERVIADHGGLAEEFVGDAVLAVFGLPRAHEDDAVRAARAAADIQQLLPAVAEETGFELALCIGIDTGEVVAGGAHAAPTGKAVTVAARLAQAAGRGEVLLGAETVRLLGSLAEAEPLAPLPPLSGKAEPVAGFRLRALAAPAEPGRSLFVGRERELALLGDALRRTVERRELHLFTLLGPAGIGKSRLAAEFADSLEAQTQVARGRCLSYGQALTYWPLVEVLRELGEAAQAALERVVSGGATSPQELAWTVQRALEHTAQERPLLVLLEDVHWAEPALLDLLDGVAELSRDAPILLLCLARPELLEQRPAWGGGKLNSTSVLLEPLSSAECELLSALARPLEPDRRQRVVELAAGNPLFVEELTHFLAEGGAEGELPPRIHALLQARLDLLPEPERHLLACAAVEGTVFHRGSLETLVAEDLRPELSLQLAALTRKELVRPARADVEGEEGFRFRHQLIRDAAYAAVPKGERAPLHERLADWLEERSGMREELQEIGAYHLEQAALCRRELRASDPALEARAGVALGATAQRALARADPRAAVGLFRRALALLDEEDPRVSELELGLALALGGLGEYEEAGQLLEQAGQRTADPLVLANVRLVRLQAGLIGASEAPAAARRACAEAIRLFEERGDHRSLGRAWWTLGAAEGNDLHVEAAAHAYANAAEEARLAGDRAREATARSQRMLSLGLFRVPQSAAVREFERLAAVFPGEPVIELYLGAFRAFAAYDAGRVVEARELACESLDAWRRAGYMMMAAAGEALIGWYEALAGDLDEGERMALAAVSELREHDAGTFLTSALLPLTEIRILQGRYLEALRLADEAEQRGGAHDRLTFIGAHSVRARAHAHLGAIEEARAAAATAVAAAEETDSILNQAETQYALAEALAAADELPAALAAALEAARLFEALERGFRMEHAKKLAEEIERGIGRPTARAPVS